jgi:hypothetical protein
MNSSLFIELENRRNDLELLFLNFPNSDSLVLSNQDKIKAFIILFHSELEYYFELISTKIKDYHKGLISTLSDYSRLPLDYFVYPIKYPEIEKEYDYNKRGSKILKDFEILISKRNNGIKIKDILSLILPLGIEYTDIDTSLLNTLNDYGEKRCKFAHTGLKFHVSIPLDRNIENRLSITIISMIKYFDEKVKNKYSMITM